MCYQLTVPEFLAVRRALRAGMRHVEIARELDLSVWTIARIADRGRRSGELAQDELTPRELSEVELPEDDAPPDYMAKNLRRCPECGAMVYVWPCIACQMAAMTKPVPPAPEVDDEPAEEEPPPLTEKQRRWRRKQILKHVFGEIAEPRS